VAVRLHRLSDHNRELFGWDVAVEAEAPNPDGLRLAVEQAFIDIAAEAMENIGRHANAENVSVQWLVVDGRAELTIEDDGVGFDAASQQGPGLAAIAATAKAAGLDLSIYAPSTAGTTVRVVVSPHGAS